MATNFPGSLDDGATVGDGSNPGAAEALSSTTGQPVHSGLHQNVGLALTAIQTKLGIGAGPPGAGKVLLGDASGSTWSATPSGLTSVTATTFTGALVGNASTASSAAALTAAVDIGGVSFDGSGSINLPGVNIAGTQDTSGTAAIATKITVADESTDAVSYPVFVTTATGDKDPKTGSNLKFNSATGALTATSFVGDLTGSVLTAAQTAITSVGTLSALALSGAITGATEITASTFVKGGAGSVSDPSIRMGDSNSGFYGGASEIKAAVDGVSELELTSTSLLVPNVYNNSTASAANVQVHTNGSIRRSTSTRAIKTNIQPLADDGLLEGLTPVSFNSIVDDDQSFWGFVAEDSFDIDPHFTDHQSDKISDRAILAKLVARVTTLTARLEALEAV